MEANTFIETNVILLATNGCINYNGSADGDSLQKYLRGILENGHSLDKAGKG